jgi:mevalonate pyrophosphate decarboxylase
MVNKELHKIVGAIFCNYLALVFNENLKGTPFYRTALKHAVSKANIQLIKAEKDFDGVLEIEEEHTEKLSGRLIDFVDIVVKQDWQRLLTIAEITEAFEKNPEIAELVYNTIAEKENDKNSELTEQK